MKFITWNINGLRTLKTDWKQLFDSFDSHVICFQETKLSRNLVEDWMAFVPNYSSYFSFPKYRSGYSGVVSYCRETLRPFGAEDCLITWNEIITESDESFDLSDSFSESQTKSDLRKLDTEGRVIITKHLIQINDSLINLFVFNVYCPRADPQNNERTQFKLNFYRLLEEKVKLLIKKSKNNFVIILGDMNTSHKRIDNCDPCDDFESNASREWLSQLLKADEEEPDMPQLIDAFRYLYPDRRECYTCWNTKLGARLTNFGTRIDYIITDSRLKNFIKDCVILSDILGSDHCPVMIEFINIKPISSAELSKLCTKAWPEFGKCRQSTLTNYFTKERAINSSHQIQTHNTANVKKLKITRQTTLSHFFAIKANSSAQRLESDTNQLQCQLIPKEGNQLPAINAIPCQLNSQQIKNNHFNNQNSDDIESAAQKWKTVFKSVAKPPNCSFHCEPCVSRKVTKKGSNFGKQFFVCGRPVGNPDNPLSRCNFFKWAKDLKN